jgi:uncharacterized protein YgiB involved in biofilm formation
MKRSKNVRLVAMGVASASILGGCSQEPQITPPDTPLFTSLDQCLGDNNLDYTAKDCQNGLEFALKEQFSDAESPRFGDEKACESDYGEEQCYRYQPNGENGGSFWMPLLGGYLVGRLLNRSGEREYHAYNYGYGGRWSSYRGVARSVQRSARKPVGLPRPSGGSIPKPSKTRVAALSRSGFGLSSSRFSGSRSFGG